MSIPNPRRRLLAESAIRLGSFFDALPLALLSPEEILARAREHNASRDSGEDPSEWTTLGLLAGEEERVRRLAPRPARILVLFCGSGREALALARMGHAVVGVDHADWRWTKARRIAEAEKLPVRWSCQEVAGLDLTERNADLVIASAPTYGFIPSQRLRRQFLSRLKEQVRPGGVFLAGFALQPESFRPLSPGFRLRRLLGRVTCGNRELEPGDIMTGNGEGFLHLFSGSDEIRAEAEPAGWTMLECSLDRAERQGVAVLERQP